MTSRFTRTCMAIVVAGALLGLTLPARCGGNCPDINGDHVVNVNDLLAVLTSWGPCPAEPAPCPANVTNSGDGSRDVNVNDLLEVIEHWGENCSQP